MQYAVTLIPDTHDSYHVQCRDLPELNSVGYSVAEALKEAADGIETVFMIYRDEQRIIPMPSPALVGEYIVNLSIEVMQETLIYNQTLASSSNSVVRPLVE